MGKGGGGGGILGSIPIIGSLFGGGQTQTSEFKQSLPAIAEVRSVTATEGAPMWRFAGRRVRVPGTIFFQQKIQKHKDKAEVGGGKESQTVTVYSYTVTMGVAFGQAFQGVGWPSNFGKVNELRAVIANEKKVWIASDTDKYDDRYQDLNTHLGGSNQNPDSIFEEIKGTGKVSGFRDTCYIFIEDLELEDWGNQVPQVWEAVIAPDTHTSGDYFDVAKCISAIWGRIPDRSSSEIDVSEVTGVNTVQAGENAQKNYTIDVDGQVEGLLVEGLVSPRELIGSLMLAYDLTVSEHGGQLKFIDRGNEAVIHINEGDLGVAQGKAGPGRPVQFRRRAQSRLPTEVIVNCYSRRTGYRRDSERMTVNLPESEEGVNVVTINLPLVFHKKGMRRICKRRLYELRRESIEATVYLLPDYIHVQESDYISVPFDDERYYIRVEQVTRGNNFLIEVQGPVVEQRSVGDDLLDSIPSSTYSDPDGDVDDDADDNADDEPEDDPENADADDYDPPMMEAAIFNAPAFDDNETTGKPRWIYAHCAINYLYDWKKAGVYISKKSGAGFVKLDHSKFDSEHILATAHGALDAAGEGGNYFPDLASAPLYVTFLEEPTDGFSTQGDDEFILYFRTNAFILGDEVIKCKNITAVAPIINNGEECSINVAGQVTRTSGSWVTDGYTVGMYIRMSEWATPENNRVERIIGISASTLSLTDSTNGGFTAETTVDINIIANEQSTYMLEPPFFRGLRDTWDHDVHLSSGAEIMLPADPEKYTSLHRKKDKIGKTFYIKTVPKGFSKSDPEIDETSIVVEGENLRPFRPVHLHAVRDYLDINDEDVEIRWLHAERALHDPTAEALHDLLEMKERYNVEIYDDNDPLSWTLLRSATIDFTDHDTNRVCGVRYSATAQSNDGVSGAPLYVRIRQRSIGTPVNGQWSRWLIIPAWPERSETGGIASLTATIGQTWSS